MKDCWKILCLNNKLLKNINFKSEKFDHLVTFCKVSQAENFSVSLSHTHRWKNKNKPNLYIKVTDSISFFNHISSILILVDFHLCHSDCQTSVNQTKKKKKKLIEIIMVKPSLLLPCIPISAVLPHELQGTFMASRRSKFLF